MILNYLDNPTVLVIVAVVMIFALMFHNVFQAWVAARLGDPGPKFSGFMRFDPQQHLEPFGVLFLFLLGFGWPKPISVSTRNYSGRGRKEALVWYSGPLAYLIVAFGSLLVGAVFFLLDQPLLELAFRQAATIAVLHAVINLFPVYPLDGSKAALAWGSGDVRRLVQQIASFGILGFILFFALFTYIIPLVPALTSFFNGLLTALVRLLINPFI